MTMTLPVRESVTITSGVPCSTSLPRMHRAAVGPGGVGKLEVVAVLLELFRRHLGLAGAVHVQDAHGGILDAAGLGGDDAVDRVLDHALDAVGAGGAGGVGNEHLLALSGGDTRPTVETPMGKGKCMVTAPSTSPFSTISSIFLWPSSSSATFTVVTPSCSRVPM